MGAQLRFSRATLVSLRISQTAAVLSLSKVNTVEAELSQSADVASISPSVGTLQYIEVGPLDHWCCLLTLEAKGEDTATCSRIPQTKGCVGRLTSEVLLLSAFLAVLEHTPKPVS